MANKYLNTAKRLQKAINDTFGLRILINSTQWYSEDKKCAISVYTIKQVVINENGKKNTIELFKSYSTVQLTLFLRDFWYELNGWEVPTDNPIWEEVKQNYVKTGQVSAEEPTIRTEQ